MARYALYRQPSALDKMALIDSGWTLYFDIYGRYLGEEEFSVLKKYQSVQKVDVVSILSTGVSLELAFNINDVLYKKETNLTLFDLSKIVTGLGSPVFSCYREVQGENGKYAQYIYLYRENVINMNLFQ